MGDLIKTPIKSKEECVQIIMNVLGLVQEDVVRKNEDKLCELFHIPELHRKEFLDFWTMGLFR